VISFVISRACICPIFLNNFSASFPLKSESRIHRSELMSLLLMVCGMNCHDIVYIARSKRVETKAVGSVAVGLLRQTFLN
jgi:hypothetical protein